MSLFANFTTGKLIMIISALMFIVLLYFFIKDFYGKVVEYVKTNRIGHEPI